MFKLFLLIIVIFAIYTLWQHVQKLKEQASKQDAEEVKPMQQCYYCQVYVSQEEAVKGSNGHWYCCTEHAQKVEN